MSTPDVIPECTAGCCGPACHAALLRPCCGACITPTAQQRRAAEAVRAATANA